MSEEKPKRWEDSPKYKRFIESPPFEAPEFNWSDFDYEKEKKGIVQEALKPLLELVNAQAEDEGLWFGSQTVSEAYLQQELRKLHALIEKLGGEP